MQFSAKVILIYFCHSTKARKIFKLIALIRNLIALKDFEIKSFVAFRFEFLVDELKFFKKVAIKVSLQQNLNLIE